MNTKRRCEEDLFEWRKDAMREQLSVSMMPDIVIYSQAVLLCEGFNGGVWRNTWESFCRAINRSFNHYLRWPVEQLLCRLNLWHDKLGCAYCGKGWSE